MITEKESIYTEKTIHLDLIKNKLSAREIDRNEALRRSTGSIPDQKLFVLIPF